MMKLDWTKEVTLYSILSVSVNRETGEEEKQLTVQKIKAIPLDVTNWEALMSQSGIGHIKVGERIFLVKKDVTINDDMYVIFNDRKYDVSEVTEFQDEGYILKCQETKNDSFNQIHDIKINDNIFFKQSI
jgi:hypothetical protein